MVRSSTFRAVRSCSEWSTCGFRPRHGHYSHRDRRRVGPEYHRASDLRCFLDLFGMSEVVESIFKLQSAGGGAISSLLRACLEPLRASQACRAPSSTASCKSSDVKRACKSHLSPLKSRPVQPRNEAKREAKRLHVTLRSDLGSDFSSCPRLGDVRCHRLGLAAASSLGGLRALRGGDFSSFVALKASFFALLLAILETCRRVAQLAWRPRWPQLASIGDRSSLTGVPTPK